jgi:hypothetical protein
MLSALALHSSLGAPSFAQTLTLSGDRPPPGSASASIDQVERWFQLETPFSRRLRLSFDARPTPTFEPLRLPTFEGRAVLFEQGRLSLSLFERVAPAMQLDCLLTCTATVPLDYSLGVDARLRLGAADRRVPETFLFALGAATRMPLGIGARTLFGVGGLLDL